MVNCFVILDQAVLVGLYLSLIRKILFQMASANESAHSLTRCKKNIHVLEKAGIIMFGLVCISKAECLVCKSETYISVVHKGNGDLNTHLQSE